MYLLATIFIPYQPCQWKKNETPNSESWPCITHSYFKQNIRNKLMSEFRENSDKTVYNIHLGVTLWSIIECLNFSQNINILKNKHYSHIIKYWILLLWKIVEFNSSAILPKKLFGIMKLFWCRMENYIGVGRKKIHP